MKDWKGMDATPSASRGGAWLEQVQALAAVLLPFCLLVGTGLTSLDFGAHWDEHDQFIRPVEKSIETETLLPFQYYYPSLGYLISMVVLTPQVVSPPPLDSSDPINLASSHAPLKKRVLQAVRSERYHLQLRGTFLVISSLAVVWVFLLVRHWRNSIFEAFLASCFLALSWEVSYHLRWLATDGVVMQFGALVGLLTILGQLGKGPPRIFLAAAAVAGLATGTKYTAGALTLPVCVAAWYGIGSDRLSSVRVSYGWVFAVFAGTYLVTTPGMLLQPVLFVQTLAVVANAYIGWNGYTHGGYHVGGLADHLSKMLEYFGLVLFSTKPALSIAVFGLILVGTLSLLKNDRRTATVFLCFPIFYVLYFATRQTMIVRNLLVLVPFFSVLAARGFMCVWMLSLTVTKREEARWRYALMATRPFLVLFVVAYVSFNSYWLVYAAESVRDRGSTRFLEEATAYLNAEQNERVYVTRNVREALLPVGLVPQRFTRTLDDADLIVFWMKKDGFQRWQDWPVNRRNILYRQFGPYEVNLNYYLTWVGDDRILVMKKPEAEKTKVLDWLRRSAPGSE